MNPANTYSLGQVIWAIWETMIAHSHGAVEESVGRFQTRFKRLLEFDRDPDRFQNLKGFAFSDGAPKKSGIQVEYSPFDGFCLLIAIQLINVGVKIYDAVFLVKALRDTTLRPQFERIVKNLPNPKPTRFAPPQDYDGPTFAVDGKDVVDDRVIMLIPKHEIVERFSAWDASQNIPLIVEPEFFDGIMALARRLEEDLVFRYSNAIFLEVGITTARLLRNLDRAPEFKRGPK